MPKRVKKDENAMNADNSKKSDISTQFIVVEEETQKIEEVKIALLENSFVVIDGPVGAGKTVMV